MTSYPHRCVLIRHGETQWSKTGQHTGHSDLPLLPEGEVQAAALAPRLAGRQFAAVLVSPLSRARATCELAGLGAQMVVDPDLCEWDYGTYDGLTTEEIRAERPGWDLFRDGAPGGEGAADVGARVDRVIDRVRAEPGDVACVAHAHVLRVMGARWLGLEPTAARLFALSPASISELGWERGQAVMASWNG
jgi:broad specificity phosphatase PhoE